MPRSFDASFLEDTRVAFRHESLLRLVHRAAVFTGMGIPPFSRAMQRLVVANVGNPLGRLMTSLSAGLFMGGETLEECGQILDHLRGYRARGILDYLVESDESPSGREETLRKLLETIRFSSRSGVPYAACKPSGLMDLAILGKVQAGADLTPEEAAEFQAGRGRLDLLCDEASRHGVRLFVDAEWVYMSEPVDEMVLAMMRKYNRERPVVYHTLQMYLRRSPAYLAELLELSRQEGWTFACKLVRGAYLDHERSQNPIDPTCPDLATTHRNYDQAVSTCLDHLDHCAVVVATHNVRSCREALRIMAERDIPLSGSGVEFAQLLGMSDLLTYNLADHGAEGFKYIPFGPREKAVPYLVRRAQENSAATADSARERDTIWREIRRRLVG